MNEQSKKISLKIVSSSGDCEIETSVNKKINALKQNAMAKLNIDPSASEEYKLVYEDNDLDEGKTLEELNIPDGAKLYLQPEPEVIKHHG